MGFAAASRPSTTVMTLAESRNRRGALSSRVRDLLTLCRIRRKPRFVPGFHRVKKFMFMCLFLA